MKLSRIAVAVVAAAAAMSASAQSNVTLYGIIDLGTHTEDSPQFGRKTQHKMMIQWECPEYRIEIEKDGKKLDLPRAISRRYTMSLGKKANLRKDLEAWRGKPFTDDEVRRILMPHRLRPTLLPLAERQALVATDEGEVLLVRW